MNRKLEAHRHKTNRKKSTLLQGTAPAVVKRALSSASGRCSFDRHPQLWDSGAMGSTWYRPTPSTGGFHRYNLLINIYIRFRPSRLGLTTEQTLRAVQAWNRPGCATMFAGGLSRAAFTGLPQERICGNWISDVVCNVSFRSTRKAHTHPHIRTGEKGSMK